MDKEIIRLALLKEDNLVDLLSTAFYGSSWFSVLRDEAFEHLIKPTSECREDKWADVLKGGGKIRVMDWEDDETQYDLSLDDIVNGLMKLQEEHLHVYARVMTFDGDADFYDADAVIQYAIFGKWVYG